MDYIKNWDKTLAILKNDLSTQAYQTWFLSIRALSFENNEITIEVPNRFHYEWLDSKYKGVIKAALKKTFKNNVKIKYSVIINTAPDNAPVSYTHLTLPTKA